LNIARSYPLLHVSSGCICPKNTRRRNQNYGQQRKSTFHRPVVLRIDLGVPRISCTPGALYRQTDAAPYNYSRWQCQGINWVGTWAPGPEN
jgi:hypothetical protein